MIRDLTETEVVVKNMLIENPALRNSDAELYLTMISKINPALLDKPFAYVMLHKADYDLPNYDSITRARRKIQDRFPELQAVDRVRTHRAINRHLFAEYARGKDER